MLSDKEINKTNKEARVEGSEAEEVLEGEVEMPHQPSEFVPDEIVEPEQKAPEVLVAREQGRLSSLHDQVDKAFLELKAEEERLESLRSKRQAIEKKLHHLKNIVTEPVKTISENPGSSQSGGKGRLEGSNLLNQKFLQKMSFLHSQANKKRTWEVEANLLRIMEFAKKHGRVTNNDVEGLTEVGHTQASKYLKMLQKDKKLLRFGSSRLTHYKPT